MKAEELKKSLIEASENVPKVYESGKKVGKKAEYDAFWDVLQNYGNEAGCNYYNRFSYNMWADNIYNPKYPIIGASGNSPASGVFYANEMITDTKVPITVLGNNAQSMFGACKNLVTIRKFIVHKNVAFSTTFVNCSKLKNIEIGGTIGQNIDFQYALVLSKESIKSIIEHLDDTTSGKTVTFYKNAVNNAFTAEEWDALEATRTNWTISLV